MKKPKLAIFTGSDIRNFGGGEKDAILMANNLSKEFDITILSFKDKTNLRVTKKYVKKLLNKKIKIVCYEAVKIFYGTDIIPIHIYKLSKIFKDNSFYAVYNYNQSVIFGLALTFLCKIYNVKLFSGIHTPDYFKDLPTKATTVRRILILPYKKLKQVFINLQKAIRVQNRLDEKKLISMGYKGKIYNIPPFINIPKKTSSTKSERFIALSVSRLSIKHKGIDLLCEVIEKTLNKTDKIIFYIVGSGDDGETLIRNLENKYPKNVKWFGFIDETILYKIYQRSNLFISTSRGENFGINVGEAQISGLPTIAFDVMGSQDIITNKIQGELIKPFDVNKFSNSIIKFYDFYNKNEAGYKNLKKKISDISIKRYNYKLIIKLLIKMFID